MSKSHPRLMITGPVDVRPEILEAQSHYMIGHRGKEFEVLFASLQSKLKQAFLTQNRVYVLGFGKPPAAMGFGMTKKYCT